MEQIIAIFITRSVSCLLLTLSTLSVGSEFLLVTAMDKGDEFPVKQSNASWKCNSAPLTFERTNLISCTGLWSLTM